MLLNELNEEKKVHDVMAEANKIIDDIEKDQKTAVMIAEAKKYKRICKLENGNIRDYVICSYTKEAKDNDDYYNDNNLKYIGKGIIHSIQGHIQSETRVHHFWV